MNILKTLNCRLLLYRYELRQLYLNFRNYVRKTYKVRGDRGYCAIDGQSMVILPSFGSAAVALHKCLCLPGPGLASLLFTTFPQAGSVSSLVLLS